jgi:ABC-type transport system substrate-binding protein
VLRIAAAVPKARIPDMGLNSLVSTLAKEALLANSPDGHPQPNLANMWTWDPSRTRLRIRLRDGILFHNGEKLTASVAAESLRKSLAEERVVSFGGVTSITAIDDATVEIAIKQPDSFLLSDLTSVAVQLPSDGRIGTGPFRIGDSTSAEAKLYAFDKYYRGRPALDAIDIQAYDTQRKAWTAMLRGEADVLHDVSRDAADFVEAETRVKTYSFQRAYYIVLAFNVRNPAFKDPAVRRAINEAIDRDLIVEDGLHGRGKPADGPVWPDHWAYSAPRHPFRYDPDAARSELDAAHFPMRRERPGDMPRRLTFNCLMYADDTRFDRTALLVQKELYEIGIDMRLEPVSLMDLGKRGATGDFDAFLFEMVSGKDLGWVYAFWHSPTEKRIIDTGYHSADAVLDDLRHATVDEDVRKAVTALNDVLSVDPPAAFIAWPTQSRAALRRVEIPEEPNRDILLTARRWRLSSPDEHKQ